MQSRSIDVGFVPEAETLLARAEKFRTTTLESGAFTWEFLDRGPSVTALREAARLGMTGIEVDRDLGGLGFGFREKVRVAEILSRSSIGFAFGLVNTQNVTARLAAYGSQRHRDTYVPDLLAGRRFGATALTEPEAGSDFAAITTSAVRTDSGWVLNGRKAWITNAVIADVVLCYAQTDPELGRDGIACFVVDGRRDGFEATDGYRLVSGSTVGVGGFSLDGYEAVEDDLIVEPGAGFRQALLGVNGARIYVAAMACAAVRAALGHAVEYGSMRESFGQPIVTHQGLAWSLANVANALEAAEALTARAVDRHTESQAALEAGDGMDGGDRAADDDVARLGALAAAHAKKFATEMVEPALEACMQAMGAEGLRADHAVGRLLSESRILSYVDGTTEMQTERIGRSLSRFYGAGSSDVVSVAAADFGRNGTDEPPLVEHLADDVGAADTTFVAARQWAGDPFAPSSDGAGLFADPVEEAPAHDSFDKEPGELGFATADAESAMADATQTIEFEPTGDVTVAATPHAPSPPLFAEPPVEAPDGAMESPLPVDPPMPPSEPLLNDAVDHTALPATPPLPPPPMAEPSGFGSPPPPPPPTGPPLSTEPPMPAEPPLSAEPPMPAEPPLSTEPPMPAEPPLSTEPPMPAEALPSAPPMPPGPPLPSDPPMPPGPPAFEGFDQTEPAEPRDSVDGPAGLVPPSPPPEFQQVDDPAPAPPPLPGEEHRLEDEVDKPLSPPLPPDSMRTGS